MIFKNKIIPSLIAINLLLITTSSISVAKEDKWVLVKTPKMMQEHLLANMRDHLKTIDEILMNMGKDELDKAAEIAEARLGMSSLSLHGASHMAQVITKEMGQLEQVCTKLPVVFP